MRQLRIVDETLRDAPQCLWASRISTAMMLPIAEKLDRIGFEQIALGGAGAIADVAIRHLKENPWERLRLMREKVTETPLLYTLRAKNDIGFKIIPNDIQFLWIERFLANGIRRFRTGDPQQDLDNVVPQLRHAKSLGAYTIGMLCYSLSPVHTDEMYADRASNLIARAAVDAIQIKDPGGLLTPDRIRTLVPAIKAVTGAVPIEVHTHCCTGLGPLVCHEAVRFGADMVHTSIAPLANGAAQPAMQTMVANLRQMGYAVDVDMNLVNEVSAHFERIAEQEGLPVGVPAEYDSFHFDHQVPGGMISNFKAQLAEARMTDKLPAILEECARIRRELGWPIMMTPFSQFVGTQALLNVVHGERYKIVPDEVKMYALGFYGKLLAPIDADLLDRIIENGSKTVPLKPEEPPPGVSGLRKKYPNISDEERLLRHSYAGNQVDEMLAAGPTRTDYVFKQPVLELLRELEKRPKLRYVAISKGDFRLELRG
jgi:oxaloacetate decarboxylase alpha subunit